MRDAFHADIDELLVGLFDAGRACDEMLTAAVAALRAGDRAAAGAVAEHDHEIDRAHQEAQRTVLGLLALQAPVATDLRRLVAILQVSVHVERLGDYATQIARTVDRVGEGVDDEPLGALLGEMAAAAVDVSQAALRSLVRMDTDLAWRLPSLDDRVDAANREAFSRLVGLAAADEAWTAVASHLVVVARSLERYGDHAVDIGEQTILAATGRIVELSSNALVGERTADGARLAAAA